MRRPPTRTVIMIVVAALIIGSGVLTMPRPPKLSTQVAGDRGLIDQVRQRLGPGPHDRLSVAVIDHDQVRTARFGADEDDSYEIGSVTKTFTGSLFAIALERGEVRHDTRLSELLDVGDGPVGDITLRQLATQSSGLPRLPTGVLNTLRTVISALRADDPYPQDPATLIEEARRASVGEKRYLYSNFGMSLLGAALAAAADTDYQSLVSQRITGPLHLGSTRPGTADDPHIGYTASGRPSANWVMGAYSGAGGLRSTLPDMITYIRAQADGSAPGADALRPIAPAGKQRIGYAWMTTTTVGGGTITWHNGGTGGFTSFVGFDRDAGRAVVVLNNTATSVDDLAVGLLEESS
ncbi:serine hydrolase domain-containing protein [Microlunatus soli]|uniref:CubicO group peptidase, beta-lactamase class C family n=1 Tax=Microlunatus soli TaxID=630515 RepID=A0A1H1R560_9ACTN|nr:serine hydrolase domain-containing protein [Microlunatus soli]SDS30848.1 CubicO group peptidase, beta-lactamase class C family [Microlunatus soli]